MILLEILVLVVVIGELFLYTGNLLSQYERGFPINPSHRTYKVLIPLPICVTQSCTIMMQFVCGVSTWLPLHLISKLLIVVVYPCTSNKASATVAGDRGAD